MHLQPPSWFEIFGFVTGAACVLLGMYESALTWPVGIASNIALFVLFRRNGVYAAAGLQLVYMAIAIYGWWNWVRRGPAGDKLNVGRSSPGQRAALLLAAGALAVALHWLLRRYTNSTVAWPDAATTALCLAAQYLLSRKLLECWFAWIAADVIYIGLYFSKGLYLIVALNVFLLAMCFAGYARWRIAASMARLNAAA